MDSEKLIRKAIKVIDNQQFKLFEVENTVKFLLRRNRELEKENEALRSIGEKVTNESNE